MTAPVPANEPARLQALRQYEILDTETERQFDDITLLASRLCGTPMAMISLVDGTRQWFKSRIGVDLQETSRDGSFCAQGIMQPGVFVVNDARADARFASSPLVTGEAGVRFYAGAPLLTADGHALGMICVNDRVPRQLTPEQTEGLQALGRQVVALFELRRSLKELREKNLQLHGAEESLQLLSSAVEQSKDSILITDAQIDLPGPRIVFVNSAFTRMTGYAPAEILGRTPRMLQGPRTDRLLLAQLRQKLQAGGEFEGEMVNYRKNGEPFDLEWRIAPLRNLEGEITHLVAIQRDVTGRNRLTDRLLQAQKLETVGRLAAGVAHEFNSILTAIIGQSEMLLDDLGPSDPRAARAREIRTATERAATLTRQLLAYGRKQILLPESIDLNLLLETMRNTLQHLMGKEARVSFIPGPGLWRAQFDRGQMEQVIVNLAMNAADAMPNGGMLTLETANLALDEELAPTLPGLRPGNYVCLSVTDTGLGMDPETRTHAFEPFFSTKEVGAGTGLGLATCYGILQQGNGHISIYSELARGTTVKVYLPSAEIAPAPVPPRLPGDDPLPGGTETILLAEDDPSLLEMSADLLRRLGYTVLTAKDGVGALNLKQQRNIGHIDLLLTDLVMPHMNGRELSERIHVIYPQTKILFTTAYAEYAMIQQGILDRGMALLPKPFSPSALARKVREVLDAPDLHSHENHPDRGRRGAPADDLQPRPVPPRLPGA